MIRSIRYALLFAIVFAFPSAVAFANGQHNPQRLLRGDYRVAGAESCVESYSGFTPHPDWYPCRDPNLCFPNVQYESTSIGLINFDGDGKAHATWKVMTVFDDPNRPPLTLPPPGTPFPFPPPPSPNFYVGAAVSECDYTYSVKEDRTFTMDQTACRVRITAGNAVGASIIINGGVSEGFIGQGRQMLVATTVEPVLQFITALDNSPLSERLCTTMSTFLRAWPNKNRAKTDSQESTEEDKLNPLPWW